MNSQFFQAVADLLRHIESLSVPTDQYGILDGGQTLECSSWLHEQIKTHIPHPKTVTWAFPTFSDRYPHIPE